jgi:iron complex outermembrane receptor protein
MPATCSLWHQHDEHARPDGGQRLQCTRHATTDNNIDLTALARFTPDAGQTWEFGYARKTRSPNLYERYTWGRGTMAMTMTNWFGDGNGYVGNIDLKPEVAHTLSATADWHAADRRAASHAGSSG